MAIGAIRSPVGLSCLGNLFFFARRMNYPLRCRCGTLRGNVGHPEKASRVVCYCKDCQSFAHFLGKPDDVLDSLGGTESVATLSQYVEFTQGLEALACMSLSPKGVLRWYASCCNTPIGNTLRDRRIAYVALVHSCLPGSSATREDAFGPVRLRANAASAKRSTESSWMRNVGGLVRILLPVARARLTGSYRRTPFFHRGSGEPVAQPKVITREERASLRRAVG